MLRPKVDAAFPMGRGACLPRPIPVGGMTKIFKVSIMPQRHCVISEQQIYCFYSPGVQVAQSEECQISQEIMKTDPEHHMAPFGLIFIQDGSHRLWDAFGMHPGPYQTSLENPQSKVFRFFVLLTCSYISKYFPVIRVTGIGLPLPDTKYLLSMV